MPKLYFNTVKYPFEYPFGISKGVKTAQDALIIGLQDGNFMGLGETTSITYFQADVHLFAQLLHNFKSIIESVELQNPSQYWTYMNSLFLQNSFLTSAIDIAAWDLYTKKLKQPLYQYLGYTWHSQIPATDYTLGISSADDLLAKIAKHPAAIYKVKLGSQQDIELLKTLRKHSDAKIRIDVNEGWTIDKALEILPLLHDIGIELMEQPLHRNDIEGLKTLRKNTHIPVIADEACTTPASVLQCIGLYDGINIKLSKCGGITPALEMIALAQKNNLQIMLGNMSDGVVGSSALSHLAPVAQYLDIDGPLLFTQNMGEGISYIDAQYIQKPTENGTGGSFIFV